MSKAPVCANCGGELRMGRQSGRWFHLATSRYDCLKSPFEDEPLSFATPDQRVLDKRNCLVG